MTIRPIAKRPAQALLIALAMLLGLLAGAPPASADPAGWTTHRLDAATIAAPPGWKVARTNDGKDLELAAPDGQRRMLVWWWFPDEPLLGYPDIVSHRKTTVAGQSALYIHSRSGGQETVSVTLDKGRKDKRRLHFLFEAANDLSQGDAVLDDILSRVTLEGAPSPSQPTEGRRSEAPPSPAPPAARVGLGRFSIEPPPGWTASGGPGALTLARPDGGARIELSLLQDGEPMPSDGVDDIEQTVVAEQPATRLTVHGREEAVFYIFDERDAAGARLSLALKAASVADDLEAFERLAESVRVGAAASAPATQANPPQATSPQATAPTAAPAASDDDLKQDPFAGLKLD
jgi:hypothetical protein